MKLLTANFLIMLTLLCKLECDTLTCFKVETTALVKEVIFLTGYYEHHLFKKSTAEAFKIENSPSTHSLQSSRLPGEPIPNAFFS